MDDLKDRSYRNYDYVSRYAPFPYYYNKRDGKYVYGMTSQLKVDGVPFVAHKVMQEDTLDSISLKYYGRPDLYWIIADFNRIQDPLAPLFGNHEVINVPNLGNVEFEG